MITRHARVYNLRKYRPATAYCIKLGKSGTRRSPALVSAPDYATCASVHGSVDTELGVSSGLQNNTQPRAHVVTPSAAVRGTVRFGLDGAEYEIDLDAGHAEALRAPLVRCVKAARRV